MFKRIVSSLAFCALLAGCESGPEYRADFDRSADFSGYRTYGYVSPLGTDKAGYSSIITTHFKNAIDREMRSRGYALAQDNPDLLVNFNATLSEKTEIRSSPSMSMGVGYYGYRGGMYGGWPMYGGSDVYSVNYKTGTANVDVVDARRKQMVWEGVVEGKLKDESLKDPGPAIDRVITEIFTKYPATAGAGAAAPARK